MLLLDVLGFRASDHVAAAVAAAAAVDNDAVMTVQPVDRDDFDSTSHRRRP